MVWNAATARPARASQEKHTFRPLGERASSTRMRMAVTVSVSHGPMLLRLEAGYGEGHCASPLNTWDWETCVDLAFSIMATKFSVDALVLSKKVLG